MAPRSRILAFGSAGVLVLAGAACAVLVGGLTGQVLTIALCSAGLGGAVLLAFLEVGLSEDRDRARQERRAREHARRERERAARAAAPRRHPRLARRPRRPG